MRRIFLSLVIMLAGMGVANAQLVIPDKPLVLMSISNYADAGVWFDDDQSNVGFQFNEVTDWDTGVRATTLEFGFYYTLSNGARWGNVKCDIPNHSVSATQTRADFNVQIIDPSVGCEGTIAELIDGIRSDDVPWTYPIEITGSMSNPQRVMTQSGMMTETNYAEGTSFRYTCQQGGGYGVNGGGFSVLIPGTESFRYFEFSADGEAPDTAWGGYSYDDCRLILKPVKK